MSLNSAFPLTAPRPLTPARAPGDVVAALASVMAREPGTAPALRDRLLAMLRGLNAPSPQPPAPEAPSPYHGDWFISQYRNRFNPNEDCTGNANCGPTALTMVAEAFGRVRTSAYGADQAIEATRARMGAQPDEHASTSAVDLARGAQSFGLKPEMLYLNTVDSFKRQLAAGKLLIANVAATYLDPANTGGHFTVVTGMKDGQVFLNDPASDRGPIAVSEQAFMQGLATQGTYAVVAVSA